MTDEKRGRDVDPSLVARQTAASPRVGRSDVIDQPETGAAVPITGRVDDQAATEPDEEKSETPAGAPVGGGQAEGA